MSSMNTKTRGEKVPISPGPPELPEPINILGIYVTPIRAVELNQLIGSLINQQAHEIVLNANVHLINLAQENTWLLEFQKKGYLTFCDGAGVILAAKILGKHIPERITYADWLWSLGAYCEAEGYSLFLLGGEPGVAEKAAANLVERYPALHIAGTQHGYFDKSPGSSENREVIQAVNTAQANILVTAFGMPLQERWLDENWEVLQGNVALTAGAALDYISGELKRAPKWMTDNGLEWLGRLIIEPGRLWKRYVLGNPLFFWRVFLQKIGLKRV